jgi:hypothetical protein
MIHFKGKVSNTPRFKYATMPDSDEVAKRIREMLLDMGNEQIAQEIVASLKAMEERDQRISDTLDELFLEVDRLLLKVDEIEGCSLGAQDAEILEIEAQEDEDPCTR